tara:strand:- start:743 stop:1081 length:339 start_codon:yes stop_codon:yes gene_type:complete
MEEPVKITISAVLSALENGFTRNAGDKNYLGEGKSIGEMYNLNKTQVALLFKNEKLKGKKTKVAQTPAFIIVDEEDSLQIDLEDSIEEVTETANIITNELVEEEASPDWLAE